MQILISIINYGEAKNFKDINELKEKMKGLRLEGIRNCYLNLVNDPYVYWGDNLPKEKFLGMLLKENGYTWQDYNNSIYEGLAEAIKGGKREKGGGSSEGETMVINSNDNRQVKNTVEETKQYRDQLKKWTEAHGVTLPTLR